MFNPAIIDTEKLAPLSLGLIVAGLAVCVIAHIWFLIVAARRSALWFLAIFFLPFTGLIFLFVEPESRKPFIYSILGVIVAIAGAFLPVAGKVEDLNSTASDSPAGTRNGSLEQTSLEQQENEVRAWQSKLEAKRSLLKPNDTAAKAQFDEELAQYMKKLDEVKQARAAAGR